MSRLSRPPSLSPALGAVLALVLCAGQLLTGAPASATGSAAVDGDSTAATAARAARAAGVAGVKLDVPPGGVLTLTGHGYGHGRGMSQYGAEGAARQGLSTAQILAFYYPGTALGPADGTISVLIGKDTTPDTVVFARSGLIARSADGKKRWALSSLRPHAYRFRARPLTATKESLAYQAKKGAKWRRLATYRGALEFSAGGAPVTVAYPHGKAAYRGVVRNAPYSGRDHDTVNILPLDSYLRGVVASEMPSSWSTAALQAQAVAARTYAAYARAHAPAGRQFQICDSSACQVYRGVAGESAATDAAVAATAGQVLTYGGGPAFTQFSSSSGGWTVAGSVAYQQAQADPYDGWAGNKQHTWSTTIDAAAVVGAWPAVGVLTGLQVLSRDGNGDWGGRVLSVKITGTAGSVTVDGAAFRAALGLKSTYFDVAVASVSSRRE